MSHHCWSRPQIFCQLSCLLNQCAGSKKDQRRSWRKSGFVAKIIDREKAWIDCSSRGVALGFMAIRDLLLPMRDGFSGEGNTNGATLSSGGHIGIGGKHMAAAGPVNSSNRFPCKQLLRAFQCSMLLFTSSTMICAVTREMLPNHWWTVQKVVGSQFDGDQK